MNKEEQMIIDLMKKNKRLEKENKELIKEIEKQKNEKAFWHIKNDLKKERIEELECKINKAIEYIEELISDTNGLITAYKYEDKEETIKRYIEDLKTDIKHYEYLEDILRGEDNEN